MAYYNKIPINLNNKEYVPQTNSYLKYIHEHSYLVFRKYFLNLIDSSK